MYIDQASISTSFLDVPAAYQTFGFSDAPDSPQESSYQQTKFLIGQDGAYELFADMSGVRAPTSGLPRSSAVIRREAVEHRDQFSNSAAIDAISRQRTKLMAMNYASGGKSNEILARLEIINNKFLKKYPRVTRERLEILDEVAQVIVDSEAALEGLADFL